jgi:hypothetical protein
MGDQISKGQVKIFLSLLEASALDQAHLSIPANITRLRWLASPTFSWVHGASHNCSGGTYFALVIHRYIHSIITHTFAEEFI